MACNGAIMAKPRKGEKTRTMHFSAPIYVLSRCKEKKIKEVQCIGEKALA